jgi:hypothetical protein
MVSLFEVVRFSDFFFAYVAAYLLVRLLLTYSGFNAKISP